MGAVPEDSDYNESETRSNEKAMTQFKVSKSWRRLFRFRGYKRKGMEHL